ncbi:MAG: AAA family ATPase, partial [Acidobacteriota bacterium]
MEHRLKIFISSPSDVRPERLIAERVVRRLGREFSYHLAIEPVMWEREPLVATQHFAEAIPSPRDSDVVVVILWSRLGVPLPAEKFSGAVTKRPVTGTEWEFEEAYASYRERKLPDLLFYRKQERILASLEDDAALQQQMQQKRLVDDFVRRWFVSQDGGSFAAASHSFMSAVEFEEQLETHLRELIRRRVEALHVKGETPVAGIRWTQPPFRGLLSFDFEHAPVFFGRTRARNELRELLARQAERGSAFVLVMGASGSGKSSLVKAGLLPDLMLPGMVGRVALCRYAVLRPSDAGDDLLTGLAGALLAPTALPELAGLHYDPATLAGLLREASGQAALPIRQGLAAAGKEARLTEQAEARLVLIVDQLEELFTREGLDEAGRERFVRALDALARSGLVWVIATMRSDFFDRLEQMPSLARLTAGEARYLVEPPEPAEIGQIIRQPAREAGLHFELDQKRGVALDETIREAASKDPGALPLLSFLLDQLWQHRTEKGGLTFAAYEELGGLEGALGRRAEAVFGSLPEP